MKKILISSSVIIASLLFGLASFAEPWDEKIWESRNSRPFDALKTSDFSFPAEDTVKYRPKDLKPAPFYEIYYDSNDANTIITTSTYRSGSQVPPFQIQYAMLHMLAQHNNSPIIINNIKRFGIQNKDTIQSLKNDFPNIMKAEVGTADWAGGDFSQMNFFTSPNGRNTLDLIKKMNPNSNPFLLIKQVTIQKKGQLSHVIISLKEPITIESSNIGTLNITNNAIQ